MALDRSKLVAPNVSRNLAATRSGNVFTNVPENATVRYRFLPTVHPEGIIWYLSANHFKMKEQDEEGKDRGIAIACNDTHGDGDCWLCKLQAALARHGDGAEKKIAKEIKANTRYNAQVLIAEKENGITTYFGPKILGLPKGASEKVSQILQNQDQWDQPLFTDPDKGQDILIGRKGKGFQTEYSVDRSGDIISLDECFPDWEKRFLEDMEGALGLRIMTNEEMKEAAQYTFGDALDWEELEAKYGL